MPNDDELVEEVDLDDEGEVQEDDPHEEKVRRLAAEAKKHRQGKAAEKKRADEAETRANSLEAKAGRTETAEKRLAFYLASEGRFSDLEAAWKLLDKESLSVDDDGNVSGIEEATEKLASEHPVLLIADDDEDDEDEDAGKDEAIRAFSTVQRSALHSFSRKGKNKKTAQTDEAALRRKYPALGRR